MFIGCCATIRLRLPATVAIFLGASVGWSAAADQLRSSEHKAKEIQHDLLPSCDLTGDANNCVRVLACVGREGLWLDGQARGWNRGTLAALRNDGVMCAGTWAADDGPFGSGTARFECTDGSEGRAIYFSQDPQTGTAIARGMDDQGRHIKAWSGQNVLEFLGDGDVDAAKLPCLDRTIPIS